MKGGAGRKQHFVLTVCLREERAGSNILFYGVYRRDQTPLYDGSQEGYKRDQRPLYDGKGLVLFCTMEASETKCPCTMEKALLFVLPDSV